MDFAPDITIRPARESDLPALEWDGLYRHYRRVYRQTFDDVRLGRRLMLLAEAEGAVIGQVFVQLQGGDHGAGRGYVYAFRVKPEWRRRGVGAQLMAAVEAELRGRGFHKAIIAVARTNLDARRLYERLGYGIYAEDSGIWHYVDADGVQRRVKEPSWLMEKHLGV